MPSASSWLAMYRAAIISLPGGLLVSKRMRAWRWRMHSSSRACQLGAISVCMATPSLEAVGLSDSSSPCLDEWGGLVMKDCVLDPNITAIRSASFFDLGVPSHIGLGTA